MTAGYGLAGAPPSGIDYVVIASTRWLQARIVKLQQEVFAGARPTKGRLSGSSRMR